jgi:hypothetical protein
MNGTGRNMYVFRDGRRSVPGSSLVDALAATLQELSCVLDSRHSTDTVSGSLPDVRGLEIDALLRAGELECALADLKAPEAERMMTVADSLSRLLVGSGAYCHNAERLCTLLPRQVPGVLQLSPAEGFAFYALHPLDFAELAAKAPLAGGRAAVVGIRSIGSTLSAIVSAALEKRGILTTRTTVRPQGHPYDRQTHLTSEQLRWVAEQRAHDADFLVVDEGPGMSGSSFLSVGEALLGAGVARSRIQFLCSRQPDIHSLCARDAANRWQGFRSLVCAAATHIPQDAKIYLGGGYWRHELIGDDPGQWPASWSQMERIKFLSPDRRTFFKFEGFSRYGTEQRERAQALQDAGFAYAPVAMLDGFGIYPLAHGDLLTRASLQRDILEHIARYCAFRSRDFRAGKLQEPSQIETMVRFNVEEEFGMELPRDFRLESEVPVLVDGRMAPQKWVRLKGSASSSCALPLSLRSTSVLKCDGTNHGDDHFFPGPGADICWDLAGAMVEWKLSGAESNFFIDSYRAWTGDDPRPRLPQYLLAYTVFRMSYFKMAAEVMQGSEEEPRLLDSYRYYRTRACALLPQSLRVAAD